MSGIIPSKPIFEDEPVDYKKKRRKAFRMLLPGMFLFSVGLIAFYFSPNIGELIPIESATVEKMGVVIGLLGIVLILIGLQALPKVKLPPNTIIR